MEGLGRHTFSGAVVACLIGAAIGVGGVQGAAAMQAVDRGGYAATDACPVTWPALQPGPPNASVDGAVSLLVGGNLSARGTANGAEGVVVVGGRADFAREGGGSYEVGSVSYGSQIAPPAGSDMLTVGGVLAVAPGTRLEVGSRIGGDAVAGDVAPASDVALYGGRLDSGYPSAVAPYSGLLESLAGRSAGYAGLAKTGEVEITNQKIVLRGDGVSSTQVFEVDGSILGSGITPGDPVVDPTTEPDPTGQDFVSADLADGGFSAEPVDPPAPTAEPTAPPEPDPPQFVSGRALQVEGLPPGAVAVVNLTGPLVDLNVNGLRQADGGPLDPTSGPAFADLSTHLLWNAPAATSVTIAGDGQLPGSLLVPTVGSTTTIAGSGTNGRVLVAGDLVHSGAGRLHSYPFVGDIDLGCGPGLAHEGTLRLDVRLQDAHDVVDVKQRFFQGTFTCTLNGAQVTPRDPAWQQRATGDRVLSTTIPVGSVCSVSEKLEVAPRNGYAWAEPTYEPAEVTVAKRRPQTITLTNRTRELALPPAPPAPPTTAPPTPIPTPTPTPTEQAPVDPPATSEPTPPPATSLPEPTGRPEPTGAPSEPAAEPSATAQADGPTSDGRRPQHDATPAITAPLTLQGAFVWGPLLMLSLLTLLLRFRRPHLPRIPKPPKLP